MGKKFKFGNTHGCLSSTQPVCPCLFWRDGRKLQWTYWLMLTYRYGTMKWSVACLFPMKPSSSRRSHYQDTTLKMLCSGRGLKMENTPANSDTGPWSMRLIEEWRKCKLTRKNSGIVSRIREFPTKQKFSYGELVTIQFPQKKIWWDDILRTIHCVNNACEKRRVLSMHCDHATVSIRYGCLWSEVFVQTSGIPTSKSCYHGYSNISPIQSFLWW